MHIEPALTPINPNPLFNTLHSSTPQFETRGGRLLNLASFGIDVPTDDLSLTIKFDHKIREMPLAALRCLASKG